MWVHSDGRSSHRTVPLKTLRSSITPTRHAFALLELTCHYPLPSQLAIAVPKQHKRPTTHCTCSITCNIKRSPAMGALEFPERIKLETHHGVQEGMKTRQQALDMALDAMMEWLSSCVPPSALDLTNMRTWLVGTPVG
jgi:hypothetical protein